MRILSTVVVVVALAASVQGSRAAPLDSPTQRATIVLDWYPNSDHAGLYTAMRHGIFARHHIDMTPHVPSDTTAQIRLVASGSADFGISYETDLLTARARHVPVRSVMCIMQHPLDTVMTLRSSGITRPRRLVGHLVGMAGSPSDRPLVSAMMTHDGASIKNLRMVTVSTDLLPALLSRKVDAVIGVYWTWESLLARQKGYAVNVMRVERWGVPNYCELVLVASEQTIQKRPAFVRDTVQALQEGYSLAEKHPDVGWGSLHAADKTLNRSLVIQSLRLLRPVVLDAPTIGYQSPRQWSLYARWLTQTGVMSRPLDVSQAFTNRFLRAGIR
ncbi:MAG: ABC transporter substrate-binding protein [Chloroflexota bacterium]